MAAELTEEMKRVLYFDWDTRYLLPVRPRGNKLHKFLAREVATTGERVIQGASLQSDFENYRKDDQVGAEVFRDGKWVRLLDPIWTR